MKTENNFPLSDEQLRVILTLVQHRLATTSLRKMAAELGFSPWGLKKLTEGTRPYRKSATKLLEWYAGLVDRPPLPSHVATLKVGVAPEFETTNGAGALVPVSLGIDTPRETVERLVESLFPGMNETARKQLLWELARRAEGVYAFRMTAPPLWVSDIAADHGSFA